jgi:hypothetical protein
VKLAEPTLFLHWNEAKYLAVAGALSGFELEAVRDGRPFCVIRSDYFTRGIEVRRVERLPS